MLSHLCCHLKGNVDLTVNHLEAGLVFQKEAQHMRITGQDKQKSEYGNSRLGSRWHSSPLSQCLFRPCLTFGVYDKRHSYFLLVNCLVTKLVWEFLLLATKDSYQRGKSAFGSAAAEDVAAGRAATRSCISFFLSQLVSCQIRGATETRGSNDSGKNQLEKNRETDTDSRTNVYYCLWGQKGATQSIENITGSQKQSPCHLLGCICLFHKASFTHENKILIQFKFITIIKVNICWDNVQ